MQNGFRFFIIPFTSLIIVACRDTPAPTEMPTPNASPTAALEAATGTPLPTPTDLPLPTATLAPTATSAAVMPNYDYTALEVIAHLNEWRISQGLWPLKLNDTLTIVAREQAEYVLSLPSIPEGSDIHLGPEDMGAQVRALRLGWPHYSTAEQIAVGEIAYVGASLDAAIDFWMNSSIHNQTVVSSSFREVGAAVLPHMLGHIYFVDFGGRPDVLPALVEPASGTLYLTSERYRWSAGGDWIHDATQVQILTPGSDTADESSWAPWQIGMPAPETGGAPYQVAYSDDEKLTISSVRPLVDIAWLPGSLTATQEPPQPTVEPTSEEPVQPTEEPVAQPAPTATSATANVLLLYDHHSLTVMNAASEPLDLAGLELAGGSVSLLLTRWETEWLTVPLDAFPSGYCLQVWTWDLDDPGTPYMCRLRPSAIYLPPGDDFWQYEDFEVRWQGNVLAICILGAGRCEVAVPG